MCSFAVVTSKQYGNSLKEFLKTDNILDIERRTQPVACDQVAIPIKNKNSLDLNSLTLEIKGILKDFVCDSDFKWTITKLDLPKSKKTLSKKPPLREELKKYVIDQGGEWNERLNDDVPKSWEKHGDIILVSGKYLRSPEWLKYAPGCWHVIASHLGASRLAVQQSISTNGYRSPQVKLLLGDDSWVEKIDNGIRYSYNITKCMFSSGNITEKLRVAGFDCAGETVVDLYAGIGYFTLPYLVHAKADFVHACEWNPDAVEALKKNLVLNKVADRCQVYIGDNRNIHLRDIADRVNLGLIPSSEEGWPAACAALKHNTGGILHIHGNVESIPVRQPNKEDSGDKTDHICDIDTPLMVRNEHVEEQNEQVPLATEKTLDKHTGISFTYKESISNNKMECPSETSLTDYCSENDKESDINLNHSAHKFKICPQKWKPWCTCTASRIEGCLKEIHPGQKWTTNILHVEHVKSYAPHIDHIVLDLECRPINC